MTPVCPAAPSGFSVRAQIAAGTCLCAGATAFLFTVDPNRHAVYPQCFFHRATGLYCAGCGATRALYALLHGRVLEALRDNALLVAGLPLFLAVITWYLAQGWRIQAWPRIQFAPRPLARAGIWTFLTLLLFMAVRNLPGPAFELLRPLGS
jgi:hypothetical protein